MFLSFAAAAALAAAAAIAATIAGDGSHRTDSGPNSEKGHNRSKYRHGRSGDRLRAYFYCVVAASGDSCKLNVTQIQAAARSPFGTISETAMNAALAMITAAAPKDEIEAALAIQMACTHAAAMSILSKLDSAFGTERRISAFGSAAARLMKTYAMQVEVLRRLRHGGHQYVRVEHVHVNSGGQAVIGNVKKQGPGDGGVT